MINISEVKTIVKEYMENFGKVITSNDAEVHLNHIEKSIKLYSEAGATHMFYMFIRVDKDVVDKVIEEIRNAGFICDITDNIFPSYLIRWNSILNDMIDEKTD